MVGGSLGFPRAQTDPIPSKSQSQFLFLPVSVYIAGKSAKLERTISRYNLFVALLTTHKSPARMEHRHPRGHSMNRAHLNSILRDIHRKRERSQYRINESQSVIETERQTISKLDALEAFVREELSEDQDVSEDRDVTPPFREPPPRLSLIESAAAILKESARPLKIGQIIDRLPGDQRGGTPYDRNRIYNSLYVSMKKANNRFSNYQGFWSLIAGSPEPDRIPAPTEDGEFETEPEPHEVRGQASPSYVEAAEMFCREKGSPFRLREFADWMISQGYKSPDKLAGIVGTSHGALKKSSKFRNDQGLWHFVGNGRADD
jgi:hypothetical protein